MLAGLLLGITLAYLESSTTTIPSIEHYGESRLIGYDGVH